MQSYGEKEFLMLALETHEITYRSHQSWPERNDKYRGGEVNQVWHRKRLTGTFYRDGIAFVTISQSYNPEILLII